MFVKANKAWKDFRYKLVHKYLKGDQDGNEPDSQPIRESGGDMESDGDPDFDGEQESESSNANNERDHLDPKDWDAFVKTITASEFAEKTARGRENQKKNIYHIITSRGSYIMAEEKLVEEARQTFEKEKS